MNDINHEELKRRDLAEAAVIHILSALREDPRKFWLMGDGTEAWEKLTAAGAAIYKKPVEKIKEAFRPRKGEYDRYCERLEEENRLLRNCREKGIGGGLP